MKGIKQEDYDTYVEAVKLFLDAGAENCQIYGRSVLEWSQKEDHRGKITELLENKFGKNQNEKSETLTTGSTYSFKKIIGYFLGAAALGYGAHWFYKYWTKKEQPKVPYVQQR